MTLLLDLLEIVAAGLELLEVAFRAAGRAVRSAADFGRRMLGRDSPEQDDQKTVSGNAGESHAKPERERERGDGARGGRK